MQSFGDMLGRRANNFDFLRFFLASLVIMHHSFPLLYGMKAMAQEPLTRLTHGQVSSGGLAVFGFFVISGFLITKSWETSRGTLDYVRKRLLRIYPGYAVAILVSVFIVGPLAGSTLSGLMAGGTAFKYLGADLSFLVHARDTLPNAFSTLPVPEHTNGSIWTIRLELMCYAMVVLFGMCGLLASRSRPKANLAVQCTVLLVLLIAFDAAYFALRDRNIEVRFLGLVHEFPYLATYFLAGMLYYLLRDRIPQSPYIFVGALAVLAISSAANIVLFILPVLLPYVLFYTAFAPGLKLQNFGKRGDFSYGMYLYGWPVQQLLILHFARWLNPWTLCFAAWWLALGAAAISWHFVEKPFLKLKARPTAAETALPERAVVAAVVEPATEGDAVV